MNVLVVGNLYPPTVFGGYEILCDQVVSALRARGHEVRVVTSDFMADTVPDDERVRRKLTLTTDFPKPGEQVGFVDFRPSALERVGRLNYRAMMSSLDAWNADVVFCWCMNRLGLGPIAAAQNAGVPVCYTVNDEHPRQFVGGAGRSGLRRLARRLAERLRWPLASIRGIRLFPVTIISEALKRSLVRQGLPFEDAEVIYQGIPVERLAFQPTPYVSTEPFRLLYVGQVSRAKGVHTILRGLTLLKQRGRADFTLDVVGTGVPDYGDELRRLAAEGGISDRVTFPGKVPHEAVARAYHDHHALVFSSEWEEPFGLTHLEAMSCGCAVVSTTTGGSAELVRDEVNALAYRAGDATELADAIERLMDDEALRLALIGRARDWVETRHSFNGYVDRIERFLENTITGANASSTTGAFKDRKR